jgi:hypothetical protein
VLDVLFAVFTSSSVRQRMENSPHGHAASCLPTGVTIGDTGQLCLGGRRHKLYLMVQCRIERCFKAPDGGFCEILLQTATLMCVFKCALMHLLCSVSSNPAIAF